MVSETMPVDAAAAAAAKRIKFRLGDGGGERRRKLICRRLCRRRRRFAITFLSQRMDFNAAATEAAVNSVAQ